MDGWPGAPLRLGPAAGQVRRHPHCHPGTPGRLENQAGLDIPRIQEAEAGLDRPLRVGYVAQRPGHHRIGGKGAAQYP
jgi:hypothetical protein